MLPLETILAVFPEAACSCEDAVAGPLTLAHAAAMDAMGVEIGRDLEGSQAVIAAWLLSEPPERMGRLVADAGEAKRSLTKWAAEHSLSEGECARIVNAAVDAAFLSYVPGEGAETNVSSGPSGYGWPLEYAEILCHEYSMRFEDAIATPIARAFALIACARGRNGGKAGGPDYYERQLLAGIRAQRAKAANAGAEEGGDGGRS